MRHPWVNTALLVLLVVQLVTGFFSLLTGASGGRWVTWLHDAGGWAIVVLLVWKGAVVIDSLARRKKAPPERHIFLILSGLLVATLLSGLIWTTAGRVVLFGYSLLTIHIVLAVVVLVLLISHVVHMRFIFSVPGAADRRAFLRMGMAAVAGVGVWQLSALGKALLDLPGAARRFTGSYETGSFSGRFPTVSWFSDDPERVDADAWRLAIDGSVKAPLELSYEELTAFGEREETAVIDCTGGWYSKQDWGGVMVSHLLDMAGLDDGVESIVFESVTGYERRFPVADARRYLLATEVAGKPLTHGHGFPARLVAPGHRGFAWVKWVRRISASRTAAEWQPPLPLQ